MISKKRKKIPGKLLDDYNLLPWHKKLYYLLALSAVLTKYIKKSTLDTAEAIYKACVNKIWIFQRWSFSTMVSFSGLPLGAELKALDQNRLSKLPSMLAPLVTAYLTQQDVLKLAKIDKQSNFFIFQERILFSKFLECIAYGQQNKVEQLLKHVLKGKPKKIQTALQYRGKFTDYSGRTFMACTAYEYAYWAKDTHMCRMLECHMDGETKAYMLERINKIESIDAATEEPTGLFYSQGAVEHHTTHFNFTLLISALQRYVDGYDNWLRTNSWDAMKDAWMEVGLLQRDIPVHVLNEYCHPDRSFYPRPEFNEENLPRRVTFYHYCTSSEATLFPLLISDSSGLGVDFGLVGGRRLGAWSIDTMGMHIVRSPTPDEIKIDMEAVSHLDATRTSDLTQSRANLSLNRQVLEKRL